MIFTSSFLSRNLLVYLLHKCGDGSHPSQGICVDLKLACLADREAAVGSLNPRSLEVSTTVSFVIYIFHRVVGPARKTARVSYFKAAFSFPFPSLPSPPFPSLPSFLKVY